MAKIAISLPDPVFQAVEATRLAMGMSRSEFFRTAAEEYLRRERDRELEKEYVRGYLEHPETPGEMAWAETVGLEALANEPWRETPEL